MGVEGRKRDFKEHLPIFATAQTFVGMDAPHISFPGKECIRFAALHDWSQHVTYISQLVEFPCAMLQLVGDQALVAFADLNCLEQYNRSSCFSIPFVCFCRKDDQGSTSEKMDFSVFLPCSSFLISTPLTR